MITLDLPEFGYPQLEVQSDADKVPELNDRRSGSVIDLTNGKDDDRGTAEHYSLQWGAGVGFQDFIRRNSAAADVMPARQLGWADLFERIRKRARAIPTRVYDAACGFGGVIDELFRDPVPQHLLYIGADIHRSLVDLALPKHAREGQIFLFRFDISNPLPVREPFDFVICRASIHHTSSPTRTFDSLVRGVAPGGRLAISAYAQKGRLRELNDDALRALVTPMSNERALQVAAEFTALGKVLQGVAQKVTVERDLEWLGIPAGEYGVQELVYDHIVKCWHNEKFGDELSNIVNFDWYHPAYAYRYDRATLRSWFVNAGFLVEYEMSIKAQHYLEGVRA